MKKLMLDPADLQVESFAVADRAHGRGTVEAAAALGAIWIGGDTAKPDCDASGAGSCGYTFCGDDTCNTCDYNTYCGESCILVCDAVATAADRA